MVFNSVAYAIFLPVVLALYYVLNFRAQNVLLLLASYFFYGWWDWRFLGLLWASTAIDYVVGLLLDQPADSADGGACRSRKLILLLSIVVNLSLLGFFKYFNFFITSAAEVVSAFGLHANVPVLRIVLPVGISFFTFQSMSYTIDVYCGKIRAVRNPLHYALFVAYFPQLVNGPIERADHMIRQYARPRRVDADLFYSGCLLILLGLFKKMAIADAAGPMVDNSFAWSKVLSWSALYKGACLFAIQIYADFSGYTDIARGTSKLLGIELMENFQQPYLSRNITEFWRRWHISLSSWLRDYLYIPLGGNRGGKWATYRNNMITMLLGGLWHGASLNYIAWGGLHGLYLAGHKMLLGGRKIVERPRWRVIDLLKCIGTLNLVIAAWIFFRPTPFSYSWKYLIGILTFRGDDGRLFQLRAFSYYDASVVAFFAALVLLIDLPQYRSGQHTVMLKWSWPIRGAFIAFLIVMILVMGENSDTPFIYFQF